MIEREKIKELVEEELHEANKQYPLFSSPHEAYAVLLEEVEELQGEVQDVCHEMKNMWVDVKEDRNIESKAKRICNIAIHAAREAIQVAAMCDKIKQSGLY